MRQALSLAFLIVCFFFFSSGAFAQNEGVEIKFDISNYQNDTLLIGYYYGDRTLVFDTIYAEKPGKFTIKQDEKMPMGMYIALYQPSNEYFQFMISEDQKFTLKGDFKTNDLKPKGDIDNETFYGYLQFIKAKSAERAALAEQQDKLKAAGKDASETAMKLQKLDDQVQSEQQRIVGKYPDLMVTRVLKSSFSTDIPDFEGTEEEIGIKKYLFFKKNYFNNIDLGDPSILRTPFLHERVTYFEEKLSPVNPDSIYKSIQYLLAKMEPAPETYKFYLSHFLNKYAKSQVIGYDAIYVHLIDDYYLLEKAPWISEETLGKFKVNADKIRPILIGQQAPQITFYKEDGTPVNLYDIESKYTVMIFWAPDCGHCKKAMPGLIEFYEKFKPKGVEVLAICTKHRDKHASCWEFIKEKELPWLNVGDQYHKSKFRDKYNVVSTPRVFILDKDKKILLKRVPTEKMSEIMEALIMDLEKDVIDNE